MSAIVKTIRQLCSDNVQRFAGRFSVLVVLNALMAVASFATTVTIANSVGDVAFGHIAYSLALGAYGAIICSFGFDHTLVRDLVQNPRQQSNTVTSSIIFRLGMLLFFLAVITVVQSAGASPSGDVLGELLIITATAMQCLHLASYYDAHGHTTDHALIAFGQRLSYLAAAWLLILLAPAQVSLRSLGWLLLLSACGGLLAQYVWGIRRLKLRLEPKCKPQGRLIWRSKEAWLASLGALTFGSLGPIIICHMEGDSAVGIYSVAWKLVTIATLFLTQLVRVTTPRLAALCASDQPPAGRWQFMTSLVGLSLAGAIVLAIPVLIAPQLLVDMLFREAFAPAAGPLRILALYVILLGVTEVVVPYLIASRNDRTYFYGVLLSSVLTTICYFIFIPLFSISGAAIAVVVGNAASLALYGRVVHRQWRHDHNNRHALRETVPTVQAS